MGGSRLYDRRAFGRAPCRGKTVYAAKGRIICLLRARAKPLGSHSGSRAIGSAGRRENTARGIVTREGGDGPERMGGDGSGRLRLEAGPSAARDTLSGRLSACKTSFLKKSSFPGCSQASLMSCAGL